MKIMCAGRRVKYRLLCVGRRVKYRLLLPDFKEILKVVMNFNPPVSNLIKICPAVLESFHIYTAVGE